MKATTAKTAVALMGTAALVGSAAMAAVPALAADANVSASSAEQQSTEAQGATVKAAPVEGTFSYDQGVVSPNTTLKNVFTKAASVICSSMSWYGAECAEQMAISVKGPVSFSATVDDMAGEESATRYLMACSCASNAPGGGAIANAEASDVSLASIASLAEAL